MPTGTNLTGGSLGTGLNITVADVYPRHDDPSQPRKRSYRPPGWDLLPPEPPQMAPTPARRRPTPPDAATPADGPTRPDRARTRAYTAADVDEWARERADGASFTEIADRHGVGRATVVRHLTARKAARRQPPRPRAPRRPELDSAALAAAYEAGATITDLAREHGTTHTTVRARLLAAGVSLDPTRRGRRATPPPVDPGLLKHACLLYRSGATLDRVIRIMRVDADRARAELQAAGVRLRKADRQEPAS